MKVNAPGSGGDLLRDLLRSVSRSFYLTLRVLPGPVRQPIGVAYLLARTTDTVADTELVPAKDRLEVLHQLRVAIVEGKRARDLSGRLVEFAGRQGQEGERVLLARWDEVFDALRTCRLEDQRDIERVLETITAGQLADVERFGALLPGKVAGLETDAELAEYTYQVAGCVGEFWTRVCHRHLGGGKGFDLERGIEWGIRYGQGLQLVNILRDVGNDFRAGRCYLPEERLRAEGATAADLVAEPMPAAARGVYDHYLGRAMESLEIGWSYTMALPRSWVRVRLACAWPVLIGVKTVARLKKHPAPGRERVKISREVVRQVMFQTVVRYPVGRWWNRLFEEARREG